MSICIMDPDGTIDSGSLIGFRTPLPPRLEKRLLTTLLPLYATAGEEIQDYYSIPEGQPAPAVGPTLSQVHAIIDWLEEHPQST